MADKWHATAASLLLDNLTGSAFCSNEHYLVLLFSEALHRTQRIIKCRNGVLEINNMDLVTGPEDVLIHLGVPETGLVSEVRTCL
jgi:hypothetical protein